MSYIDNSDFSVYYACPRGEDAELLPMHIAMAGDEQCSPAYRVYRANAEIGVLIYLLSGEGVLETGGSTYELCPGDVLAIPQGTTYEYRVSRAAPWRILWFNITGELYQYLLKKYGLLHTPVYREADGGVLESFIKGMDACKESGGRELVQSRLCAVVYEIVLALWRQYRHSQASEGVAARLRQYIDDWISADQSLGFSPEQAAMQQGMSARQLERAFKEEYDCTPYRYYQNQKLVLAKQYLRNTGLTIKEISAKLGFCDPYYFSNCFKSREGVSPKAYRQGAR